MADDLSHLSPQERARVLLERQAQHTSAHTPPPIQEKVVFDADLIPQVEQRERSPEDTRLDSVLDSIDIVEAYVRLIGKMHPDVKGKREGIKISCPMPGHPDNDPSAWINLDKQAWFCGGCQIGGDIYDLAAIHFGYPMPGYKDKGTFPKLRRQLAEKFGYTVVSGISGEYAVKNEVATQEIDTPPATPLTPQTPATPATEPAPDNVAPPAPAPSLIAPPVPLQLAPVIPISPEVEDDLYSRDSDHSDLFIPWDKILPQESFLHSWMEQTTIDDLPHEFYFWLGMQALGFAGNTKNLLSDFQPVKPNLYVCLYGRTGLGKSRSLRPYLQLVEEVFPFTADRYTDPSGVRILPTPNSAEAIIDSFRWDVLDSGTQQLDHAASVVGLMRHEELSGLISKASRHGSSIKEVLIEMYDVLNADVTTHSRTSGIARAHNPFCQMISTTQPNAIHAFLRKTDIESGFLNRFVFAGGRPRIAPISYGGVMQDIALPAHHLRDVSAWANAGHTFRLEGDALDAWSEFFEREMSGYKSGEEQLDSILSRIDLTLKKVIILFTLNEMKDQPTGDIVERALALYPYLQVTYSMFARDITFNDVSDCQTRLIEMMRDYAARRQAAPSKRDLARSVIRRFDGEVVVRALRNLIDLGVVEEIVNPAGTRGRPTTRYALAVE